MRDRKVARSSVRGTLLALVALGSTAGIGLLIVGLASGDFTFESKELDLSLQQMLPGPAVDTPQVPLPAFLVAGGAAVIGAAWGVRRGYLLRWVQLTSRACLLAILPPPR